MEITDSTLREGEQRSGTSYSVDQKVAAAERLDELGVDTIQVGIPVAEDGTREVIERLDTDARLTGLARAVKRDIDASFEAGVDCLGFGVPAGDLQRAETLGMDEDEVVDLVVEMYEYASDYGLDVQVGAMDSFRAGPSFLNRLIDATDTPLFRLLDTVGIATPATVADYLDRLECDPARLGVHFHRDLGVATANVLTAAEYGVGTADVTVGGIGDRVGNTALEEVVVAGTVGSPAIDFDLDVDRLVPHCLAVLDALEEDVPPHKAVLGQTAFEHESGIHTATMLDDPSPYEAFAPERFGGNRRLLFGPSSGRGAARRLLERAGLDDPSDDAVEAFLDRLHELDENVELEAALELATDEVAG